MAAPGPERKASPDEVRDVVDALEALFPNGVPTVLVANTLGVEDRTARKYLASLADAGVLERHCWPRPRTGGELVLWRTTEG
jgi:predicted ArsR family transcriptional regulator